MADRDLILAKAGAIEKYLNRIKIKRETDLKTFLADIDRQESVLFNSLKKAEFISFLFPVSNFWFLVSAAQPPCVISSAHFSCRPESSRLSF